ncbi:ribosome biogenesis protein WDR12 homolog isoform X1 [Halichondria panicea]|uniref:ribosome biogenesis protein WDR12 homolog isoform X1 n=1 Tax=Halichondria panicea TaxID=6063 RepID=UPI00312BB361
MDESEVNHIQASFFTKDSRYFVQDTSFSLPVNVTPTELSSLICQLLESNEADISNKLSSTQFDFLINGELIRDSLDSHVTSRDLPTENVIAIEYVERSAPPSLTEELSHQDWVSCAHCSRRFILSGCYDNSVSVWSHSGKLVSMSKEHSGPVKDVKWVTPNVSTEEELLFLSASQDQNIHLWQLSTTGSTLSLCYEYKGHARSVEAIAVSPDATKFCSVSWDTFLKIWSAVPDDSLPDETLDNEDSSSKRAKTTTLNRTPVRTPIVTFQGHSGPVSSVEWVGEGELVTAGWDHCLRTWDVHSGENKTTLTGSKVFHDISWSSLNGLVASANSDKLVRIWDLREKGMYCMHGTSMIQSTLSSHQGWVVCVNWSPIDEHQLLSGSYDSTLKLWDIRSSKLPLYTISAHEGKVLCSDWSLPQMFVSGGDDNKLRTYSV